MLHEHSLGIVRPAQTRRELAVAARGETEGAQGAAEQPNFHSFP